jgi:hypothetical protein
VSRQNLHRLFNMKTGTTFREMQQEDAGGTDLSQGADVDAVTRPQFMSWWRKQPEEVQQFMEVLLAAMYSVSSSSSSRPSSAFAHSSRRGVGNDSDKWESAADGMRRVGGRFESGLDDLVDTLAIGGDRGKQIWSVAKSEMGSVALSSTHVVRDFFRWAWKTVPRAPGQFWSFLTRPVVVGDDTSAADWWKIFSLQLLAYACPPLIFLGIVHKEFPGTKDAQHFRRHLPDFVQRLWWLGTSFALIGLWYSGQLASLAKSEIFFNICMYSFVGLMNSYEHASLAKRPVEATSRAKVRPCLQGLVPHCNCCMSFALSEHGARPERACDRGRCRAAAALRVVPPPQGCPTSHKYALTEILTCPGHS